eukprot:m.451652 g.451652  ORF g.451652 m.451652 type:complete len:81 (-) comp56920_c0_seq1:1826-2068(-)
MIATQNENISLVQALLDAGANPSVCEDPYWTPLHISAYKGFVEILGILLATCPSFINAQDVVGRIKSTREGLPEFFTSFT